jgi:pectin methylesterase-like acyl-CoA thioesterase
MPHPRVRRPLRVLLPAAVAALLAGVTAALVASAPAAYASTLFSDDFTDGNTAGWSMSGGIWKVVTDGSAVLAQTKAATDNGRLFAGSSSWTDYRVQARIKPTTLTGDGYVALLARASGATTYYRLALRPGNLARLEQVRSGAVTVLASAPTPISAGVWYQVAVEVSGSTVRGWLDGSLIGSATTTAIAKGRIGVQTGYATAEFDDVLVSTGSAPSPSASSGASPGPSTSPSPSMSPSPSTSASASPAPTGEQVSSPPPTGPGVVVAQDGTGDFTSVQAAVDAAPSGLTSPYTILIKPGSYVEPVLVPSGKPYLSFVGASGRAADVLIAYDRANGTAKPDGTTYGTSGSASVTIAGHDFTARNLTFANTFDEAAHPEIANRQAVAVLTSTDRLTFDNVRFLGNQDTLYVNSAATLTVGRAYFYHCYVEGDVDFIFGRGTAVFDECEIHSLNRDSTTNNGYVTAASTQTTNPYGFLFDHCELTSDAPDGTVYLGRPWHPSGDVNAIAQVVYRESSIGAHIIAAGPWSDFSTFSWKDARYFEYHNTGPGAVVNDNRPQLTDDQAATYTIANYLAGPDNWHPQD